MNKSAPVEFKNKGHLTINRSKAGTIKPNYKRFFPNIIPKSSTNFTHTIKADM